MTPSPRDGYRSISDKARDQRRTADYYAELKSAQRRAGRPLDENDLWIAATAMTLGATVVSRGSDFRRIEGLPVIEPRYQ